MRLCDIFRQVRIHLSQVQSIQTRVLSLLSLLLLLLLLLLYLRSFTITSLYPTLLH